MSEKNVSDIIIERMDRLEDNITKKLDEYNKEFLSFKFDTKSELEKVHLKLDGHDSEIKNIKDRLNLPWSKRILEIFAESSIKSIGAILGLCIFTILVGSFGGNIAGIIKTFLTALIG